MKTSCILFKTVSAVLFLNLSVAAAQQNAKESELNDPVIQRLYAPNAPYSQFNPNMEIDSMRTESSKTFKNEDGSFTALLTAGAMHYLEYGKWKTSSNEIIPNSSAEYPFANLHNEFKTYYGNIQRGVNFRSGNAEKPMNANLYLAGISSYGEDKNPHGILVSYSGQATPSLFENGAKIGYELASEISADIEQKTGQVVSTYKINSNIFGSDTVGFIGFTEKISFGENVTPYEELDKNGGAVAFKNTAGKILIHYGNLQYYNRNHKQRHSAELVVRQIDSKTYEVTTLVPKKYFANSAAEFPVYVDPTATLYPNNSDWWTGNMDNSGGTYCNNAVLWEGFRESGTSDYRYSGFAKMNISSIPTNVCAITQSLFRVYQYDFDGSDSGWPCSDDTENKFVVGWANTDPVPDNCNTISNALSSMEQYYNWMVINSSVSTCSGCNGSGNYNRSSNAWKDLGCDYTLCRNRVLGRAQAGLGYMTFGMYCNVGSANQAICDDSETVMWRSHTDGNRPQLLVTYYVKPTISSTTNTGAYCAGSTISVTTNPTGGTTPYSYAWSSSAGGSWTGAAQTSTRANSTTAMAGTYTVTVTGTGGTGCTVTASTTVVVNPANTITLSSGAGSNAQSVCVNAPIATITYNTTGAIGANISGLPTGVTGIWSGNVVTISGSPSVTGTFTYTIDVTGGCDIPNITGTITVLSGNTITLSSAAGTDAQSNCINTAVTNITYTTTGATGATFSGLPTGVTGSWASNAVTISGTPSVSGNFSYTVTLSGGCGGSVSATGYINVFSAAAISAVTATPAQCNGAADGAITITAAGGTPSYQYSIDNGTTYQASNVFSNLTVGSYTVKVKDVNNCSTPYSANPVSIIQPTAVSATATSTAASCSTVYDGIIVASGSGGTLPYTYSLNGGPAQSGNTFTGLSSGTYIVSVIDNHGCTDTANLTIGTTYTVTGTLDSSRNVSCFGNNDGAAYVSLAGGVPAYQYSIDGLIFQATPAFTGLSAGNYTVILKDSRGCAAYVAATITQPSVVTVTLDSTVNGLCAGAASAGVYISVAGGTPPYTYHWNNNASTQNLTGIPAGTYNVTVTDANGCSGTIGTSVSQPLPLYLSIAQFNNVYCNGDSSGAIDITVNGGTPPYHFAWSDGETTEDIYHLSASATAYAVTVTDTNGCQKIISQTITEPTVFTVSATATNATCAAGGTASVTPSGGVLPYSVLWSNGDTTATIDSLAAGNYTASVTDANGCVQIKIVTITAPAPLSLSITSTAASCATGTGSLDLTVTGGSGSPTYSWMPNGAVTEDLTNVSPGTYNVTVTDGGCTATTSGIITAPTPISLSIVPANALCSGGTGSLNLTVNGASGAQTYSWTPGGAVSEDLTNVAAGSYTVTVTDGVCSATQTGIITEPSPLLLTTAITNIACNGGTNGAIDLSVYGGTAGYTYLWGDGAVTQDRTALSQGTYTVTVTDTNSCTATANATVSNPAPISVGIVGVNPLCNAANGSNNTGKITGAITGGTPNYTYNWSDISNAQLPRNNVPAGTYHLTVTDASGCSAVDSVSIVAPQALAYSVSKHDVSCAGTSCNGSLDLSVSGGTTPYSFVWSNSATTEDLSALCAGNYAVTVTDQNNCTVSSTPNTIAAPTVLNLSLSKTDVACQGGNSGSVTASVTGGQAPYSYLWTAGNSSYSASQTNIGSGVYCVQVTDSNGCQAQSCITVAGQPNPIYVTPSVKNPTCYGETDGFASVAVAGGQPPYAFAWSTTPAQTGTIATSLSAGTYTVTISDAAGCSFTQTLTVTSNPQISLSVNTANTATCVSGADGTIVVTATNGIATYVYSLNGQQQTSDTFTHVRPGNYLIEVRDANGCEATTTTNITNASGSMSVDLTADRTVAIDGQSIQLTATAVSDSPIVRYSWQADSAVFDYSSCADTTDCRNPVIHLTASGNVIVTAVNSQGCQTSDTLYITVKPKNNDSYFFPTAFTPNGDGLNDRFEFNVLGCTTANVQIWNRWGQQVYSNPNQANGFTGLDGWDGSYGGKKAQFDTYTYQIVLTFFDNHTETVAGTITVME